MRSEKEGVRDLRFRSTADRWDGDAMTHDYLGFVRFVLRECVVIITT